MSLFKCIIGKEKTGFGIAMKSVGCGILLKKERECGIGTPPSRPCEIFLESDRFKLITCRDSTHPGRVKFRAIKPIRMVNKT